jgi:hypothetical protein
LQLGSTQLKVGWGRPAALPIEVTNAMAIGACRALCMTNIGVHAANEAAILTIARAYGDVENILVQADQRSAFINMTDINNAIKAQKQLDGTVAHIYIYIFDVFAFTSGYVMTAMVIWVI